MKRLFRITNQLLRVTMTILSALSMILFVLVAVLWIRSYPQQDEFMGDGYGRRVVVQSVRGTISIRYMGPAARFALPTTWSHRRSAARELPESFGAAWEFMPGMPVRVGYLVLPHYVFALITLAIPGVWFWVILRSRDRTAVHLPTGFPITRSQSSRPPTDGAE